MTDGDDGEVRVMGGSEFAVELREDNKGSGAAGRGGETGGRGLPRGWGVA